MPRECTRNFCWTRKMPAAKCAKGSIRTIKRGRATLRVCCPKGHQAKRGRCKVGMKLQSIGKRR